MKTNEIQSKAAEGVAQESGARSGRRALLKGVGALAALGVVSGTREASAIGMPDESVAKAAADCSHACNVCLGHAIALYQAGDISMATCTQTVTEAKVVADALGTLAGMGSEHVKTISAAVSTIAAACETECRKHAGSHTQCKECADACSKLVKALKKA